MRKSAERITFTVPGRLPSLNEYTEACRRHAKAGAKMKKVAEHQVMAGIVSCTACMVPGKVSVSIKWVEKDRRRDLDNVSFAKKFVLDAMVRAGVIGGDDQRHVVALSDTFATDGSNPRVEVTVERK